MNSRSTSALRKPNSGKAAAKTKTLKPKTLKTKNPASQDLNSRAKSKAGRLPEWNLSDLYGGIDAPEVARDLARMDAECVAFETAYKGKLAEHASRDGGGAWLAEALKRYEAIDDLAGRLGSFAGLVHAGDSVDPAISKFYGDVSERLTAASTHLLFFALELNHIDDVVLEGAMQTPALALTRHLPVRLRGALHRRSNRGQRRRNHWR